jgi:hypothetical protein
LFYFFGNKAELEAMRGYGGPEILLEEDYSWAVRVDDWGQSGLAIEKMLGIAS